MIHTGDCIEVMRTMEPDSVDAVVTDPPYNLSFMGKSWDAFGKVAKQGGEYEGKAPYNHVPRTAINGFMQKGRRGLSIDESSKSNVPFQAWCEAWGHEALRVTKPGGYLLAFGGTRTHHRLVCGLEDAGWIIRDELDWIYASGFPKGKANLKPAHEPIVLARKPGPLRPLGIEETRIGTNPGYRYNADRNGTTFHGEQGARTEQTAEKRGADVIESSAGRWPSNLLLSSPELFDEQNPAVVGSGAQSGSEWEGGDAWCEHRPHDGSDGRIHGGSVSSDLCCKCGARSTPGYSRFFIIPKADRADREPVLRPEGHEAGTRFSVHPTVKPTDLMRHLIRLVTPPGGTVLDCFAGSGSTLVAAELEGYPWIGIEQDESYVKIIEARLNGTQRGLGLAG